MTTAAITGTTAAGQGTARAASIRQGRRRIGLPSGLQSGDVTTRHATLWARADAPGQLVARLDSGGRRGSELRGPHVGHGSDLTGRFDLSGLQPGRDYRARLWFEDRAGYRGEVGELSFSTAAERGGATSFVWTGDTAGQGWGINPDLGGMTAYAAMHRTRPDFFVHSGDTIYADSPFAETVVEPDGQIWRNLLTPEVTKVAETLAEYRGRHRYNLMDHHVRAFYADTPVVASWDDHETVNNWYPGEVLDDPRYGEKRVDVLAARARRAWQEFQPIRTEAVRNRGGDGFATERIYRKVERGRHLDVFCLDMRTHKSPNTAGLEVTPTQILGENQMRWLVREVSRSTATWKVISADLPLGLVVPDGAGQEAVANGDPGSPLGREPEISRVLRAFRRAKVRNVVWLTADVHYCAAHHYDPQRAAFTDFDPFWEFVAGPINAGVAPAPSTLDGTFGPQVMFSKAGSMPGQSPRGGTTQFFGHVAIDRDGRFTVGLRDGSGAELWTTTLEPRGPVPRGPVGRAEAPGASTR